MENEYKLKIKNWDKGETIFQSTANSYKEADLCGSSLFRADLENADLRGADLRYTNLVEANLRGADIRGVDMRKTDLRGADIYGANLHDTDFGRAEFAGRYKETKLLKQNQVKDFLGALGFIVEEQSIIS